MHHILLFLVLIVQSLLDILPNHDQIVHRRCVWIRIKASWSRRKNIRRVVVWNRGRNQGGIVKGQSIASVSVGFYFVWYLINTIGIRLCRCDPPSQIFVSSLFAMKEIVSPKGSLSYIAPTYKYPTNSFETTESDALNDGIQNTTPVRL